MSLAMARVRGGLVLAASFFAHTHHHLLSQFGYAAVLAFVTLESLGVPFPAGPVVITAVLYASLTHPPGRVAGVGSRGGRRENR